MVPSIAFILAALVLAVTPGPGLAYVVARTAAGGRTVGLASCAGTGVGGMFHVVCAAVGLSVLVAQSAVAFSVVKYLGAAYLIYLGLRLLCSGAHATPVEARPVGARRAFLEGIAVEALNVKTALFFMAFLPQFLVSGPSVASQLVVMGTICVALNTLVDTAAVLGAARLLEPGALGRKRATLMGRLSGLTLVGLGVYVAASKRAA